MVLKSIFTSLLALAVWGAQASAADATHTLHAAAPAQAVPAAVPAPMAKSRPQLGSGVAFAPDGSLWLVGVNAQGQLFVQTAPPGDVQHWGAARVLDTQDDTIAADGESRPTLAFGPKGLVVISYAKALGKPYTAFVRMLRSTDGGQTFSAPFTVHTDRQEITHRFDAIAFDAQGALHTVWIDKRDLEAAPKAGAKSSYRGAAIYRNVSLDGGATFGADLRLADHSCECCRIALAQGGDGRVRALWRHVFAPDVRDHAIAVLDASAAAQGAAPSTVPVRATFDDWHINGCPHHGPALVAAEPGGFHAVWFGIRTQGSTTQAAVRYGRLNADGSPVADSVRALPDARAEHADVQAAGRNVAVVWRSSEGERTTAKAWLSNDGGRTFRLQVLGEVSGPNDFPRLARHADRIVAVWRNPQEVPVYALAF